MFTLYTAANFSKELIKTIARANYSIELLINQDDILVISKSLFQILEKDINADIIISSNDHKKPLRMYNLVHRLIDCGANVYWNTDSKIYGYNSHFLIYDKTNVINKIFYRTNDDIEKQVLYFENIFSKIIKNSQEIKFKDESIKIKFYADKTIVYRNQLIRLNWTVENADFFKISPMIENVNDFNSIKLQLQNDTLFKLEASNKKENISKHIFIKVINSKEFTIDVKVFDPFVEEFIFLSPIVDSKVEKFICYYGQTVILKYKFMPDINVFEKRMGKLKPNQEYSFVIKKHTNFIFNYSNNGIEEIKKIQIRVQKDEIILNKLKNTPLPKID